MHKTTTAHFEIFKKACQKWVAEFGLTDWRIIYEHSDELDDDAAALCAAQPIDRVACIMLSTNWDTEEPTEQMVRLAAFHEVTELLTMGLYEKAMSRSIVEQDVMAENHILIRRLENFMLRQGHI